MKRLFATEKQVWQFINQIPLTNICRFEKEARKRSYKKAHECLHGLVADEAAANRPRKSQDAQFRDLQKTGVGVENFNGKSKATFHR